MKKMNPDEAGQKLNKFVSFLQKNPIYFILGLILVIFQIYQMIDLIFNKLNNANINVVWNDFIYIILSFILSVTIIILIYKNVKKKYLLNSLPYSKNDLSEMKKMGIVQCISKLTDTDFTPVNCMNSVKRKLLFMGVGGSKWVQDPANFQLFRKMLLRVTANNGEVKFLIIHPYCKSFELMKEQREGATVTDSSYKSWIQLIKEFSRLQVKCYNHTPTFRLQFMDDTLMAVSRYQFERKQYDMFNQGWGSPHLIIDNTNVMSFYNVFENYFFHEWNDAKDLMKIKELN